MSGFLTGLLVSLWLLALASVHWTTKSAAAITATVGFSVLLGATAFAHEAVLGRPLSWKLLVAVAVCLLSAAGMGLCYGRGRRIYLTILVLNTAAILAVPDLVALWLLGDPG